MCGDESILAAQSISKAGQYNFSEPIKVNDSLYEFERHYFCGGYGSILLPKQLETMEEDEARRKYPSIYRPKVILTTADRQVNFCYSELNECIENLSGALNALRMIIKQRNPANIFWNNELVQSTEVLCGYFDYLSYGFDHDFYNLLFLVKIDDHILLGNFNCFLDISEEGRRLVRYMLETLQKERSS